MQQPSVQIKTPLGNLKFLAESADIPISGISIQTVPFSPKIPPGMSVLACYGVILQIDAANTLNDLRFKALLEPNSIVCSGATTGEGIEAQDWNNRNYVMLVGTEDLEYLRARVKHCIVFPDAPFTYSNESLSIHIMEIPSGESLSLHFVVAWNKFPEIVESSCWFAVDQSHISILSATGVDPTLKSESPKAHSPLSPC